MPNPLTITQIAEAAGVSTATVDRVLNNRPGVNPATVHKVRETMAALGGGAPVRGRPRSTSNYRFAFVLPATRRGFFDRVDRVIAQAAGDFRHQHITEVTHRLPAADGAQFAAELMKLTELDGIALLAPDVPPVKLAINELVRAGVHVVTLTLSGKHLEHYQDLAGVALPVAEARVGKRSFRAGLLFTHRGISGPSILQISSYWQAGDELRIDLSPQQDIGDWLIAQRTARPAAELRNVLGDLLPRRLAQRLCELWLGSKPMRQYRDADLHDTGARLHDWPIIASGTEGYRTAEVTLGGVDTDGLSSSTMQSKHVPGLYFIGEVVDVTGWLGGYNFQWAWASGRAAGEVA